MCISACTKQKINTIMELSKILENLISNPFSPKTYRELRDYYLAQGMVNEAEAFSLLLYQKFREISDGFNHNAPASQESSETA